MAFEIVIYTLALVGMAGVGLVPLRLWDIVVTRRMMAWSAFRPAALFAALTLAAIGLAAFAAVETLPRVFHCLADSRSCSANRAGGLIGLAGFGVTVVMVEISWLVFRLLWRRDRLKH